MCYHKHETSSPVCIPPSAEREYLYALAHREPITIDFDSVANLRRAYNGIKRPQTTPSVLSWKFSETVEKLLKTLINTWFHERNGEISYLKLSTNFLFNIVKKHGLLVLSYELLVGFCPPCIDRTSSNQHPKRPLYVGGSRAPMYQQRGCAGITYNIVHYK